MGLFSKKKKRDISKVPELPKFEPDEEWMADDVKKAPEVPSYESAFTKKSPEIELPPEKLSDEVPPMGNLDMPAREPSFTKSKPVYNERVSGGQLDELLPMEDVSQDFKSPFRKDEAPSENLGVSFEKVPKVERKKPERFELGIGKEFKIPKKITSLSPFLTIT